MPHDQESTVIQHSVLIRAPRPRVFQAFATAEGLNEWFTTDSRITDGARIEFRWKDWGPQKYTGADEGSILANRAPERFSFLWSHEGSKWQSLVELTFQEFSDGTLVRLRESGFPDTREGQAARLACAVGWGEALALAKFWLEHGIRF